ncbi:hypothetical protein FAP39_06320 [Shimia litoralis]|uniref:Uncharacterized protein n=1 Tax=Shimia litoralis TaxID=420403 RepID=A0A4V6YFK8_9RHOB|nr:hypothetical protein [Shimia litoralis]TKZ21351.1 hypothetical protein FAP39_06320 [Shimia litoralis]
MASALEFIFAFFSVGIFVGAFLLFIKKYRKLGLRLLLASTVVSFGVFSVQEYQKNQHAQQLGFLSGDDWQAAVEAGIENPQDWAVVRTEREAELTARRNQKRLEEACGDDHSVMAYVMSQRGVRANLRSPATVDFPTINSISVHANGDCTYSVNAYVDAQNGFGALVRTNYSATMRRNRDTETWSLLELNM